MICGSSISGQIFQKIPTIKLLQLGLFSKIQSSIFQFYHFAHEIILLTFSFKGALAEGSNVLVVGAGPCGLRTAIETQMLGATTVIIERRDGFTRNNVLKLWKFLMEDIKSLGGKKLFGMFCAGNINHVGIKTLQLILSKVAMLLGKQSWSQQN